MAKEIGFDGIFSDESDAVNTDKILQNRIIADRYSLYYETSHSKIKGCEDKSADILQHYMPDSQTTNRHDSIK